MLHPLLHYINLMTLVSIYFADYMLHQSQEMLKTIVYIHVKVFSRFNTRYYKTLTQTLFVCVTFSFSKQCDFWVFGVHWWLVFLVLCGFTVTLHCKNVA